MPRGVSLRRKSIHHNMKGRPDSTRRWGGMKKSGCKRALSLIALMGIALSRPSMVESAFSITPLSFGSQQREAGGICRRIQDSRCLVATESDQEQYTYTNETFSLHRNGRRVTSTPSRIKGPRPEYSDLFKDKFRTAQREKKALKQELAQLRKEIEEASRENEKLRGALGDSAMNDFQLRYLQTENARLQEELKATVEKASALVKNEQRPQNSRNLSPDFNETEFDDDFPYVMFANETVASDLDSIQTETSGSKSRIWLSHRALWKRRNAKSAEEGIRREKLPQLSSLLDKAKALDVQSPRYAARTLAGLVSALAEEVDDLDVEVVARPDTPFWDKSVDEVKITFSRLGFKPFKMGGLDQVMESLDSHYPNSTQSEFSKKLRDLSNADDAFRQIDVDNSGYLDRDEIGKALLLAAGAKEEADETVIEEIASDLLELYDSNGDGVVDRSEYQRMVEDMAALTEKQESEALSNNDSAGAVQNSNQGGIGAVRRFFTSMFSNGMDAPSQTMNEETDSRFESTNASMTKEMVNVTDSEVIESVAGSVGSITLSDLKLDLRRLVFGAVPIIKRITPGGPLILEPFTVTVSGSFSRDDIMKSPLLEDALSRLISLVLRRRVRSIRDTVDLAVLFGRDYKLTSKNAPFTKVTELTNVEFDRKNRLIMTGRAKVRTSPGAPTLEQAFKVRAKLGTRKGGQFIRLVEPELAFVVECPKTLEENLEKLCGQLKVQAPPRPPPIYSFFPIYSPFKVDDSDGFDLGEDNAIKNIYIQDGALRFELRAVLRPGRFLGSHYIAFTLPMRTFIITLDRVREGIRSARKAKREKREEQRLQKKISGLEQVDSKALRDEKAPRRATDKRAPVKSFFSRFVDGYMQAREEPDRARFASAIRDFFGRQGTNFTANKQ